MSGDEEGDGKPDEGWYHAGEVGAAAQTDLPPIHARFDRNEATSTGFTCEVSVRVMCCGVFEPPLPESVVFLSGGGRHGRVTIRGTVCSSISSSSLLRNSCA